MRTPETIFQNEENSTAGFPDARKAAYEAGLLLGREAGYKQGFQDGFLASMKTHSDEPVAKAEVKAATVELAPNGRPLVGPPCVKCGHCYPGSLTQCPRCDTPAPTLRPRSMDEAESLSA